MQIGLLITQRCNAACTHCTTSCGPDKNAALSRDHIFNVMNEAAGIHDGRPLVFSLSGGEPFLDFPLLLDIVSHGARLGGQVTCVTNGYWASSDEKARSMLTKLKQSGLRKLGVSTSRFHQRFVKVSRVQRALKTAVDVGIGAVLKHAFTRSDQAEGAELKAWAQSAGVTSIESIPVLPYLREDAQLPPDEFLADAGLPSGKCPAPSLTVREDGAAYSCCAPGGFVEFLSLGNAVTEGLQQPYRRFWLNGTQKVLREKGPIHFARAIRAQGLGHLLRDSYVGVCDLCAHISSDPQLMNVARAAADAYEVTYLQNALRDIARSGTPQTRRTTGRESNGGEAQKSTHKRAAEAQR